MAAKQAAKRIFLAGIIQGSLAEAAVHDQGYRRRIKAVLAEYFPEARVYCPVTAHPNSLAYDDRKGRRVFLRHVRMASDSDLVIAYLPSASMGTAIELWEAHRRRTPVVCITPLTANWVVRFLGDLVVRDLEEFAEACRDGRITRLLGRARPGATESPSRRWRHGN